jgi:hypothetical protein
MTAYADLEIGLHRRDAGRYGVELRFSHPGGDADIRLTSDGPKMVQFDFDRLNSLAADDEAYRTATAAISMRDATVQAVQTELARVQATQTAAAGTPIPTSLANSVRDFGNTQGAKGWKYLVENGRNSGQFLEMRFGEYNGKQCWLTDGEEYVRICPGGEVHPGVTTRVAYEWKSAADRDVHIHVHAYKRDTSCGDGVKVEVFKINAGTGRFDKLGEFGIAFDDGVGITGNYDTKVTPGTLVYALVDIFGNAGCDETGIEIVID